MARGLYLARHLFTLFGWPHHRQLKKRGKLLFSSLSQSYSKAQACFTFNKGRPDLLLSWNALKHVLDCFFWASEFFFRFFNNWAYTQVCDSVLLIFWCALTPNYGLTDKYFGVERNKYFDVQHKKRFICKASVRCWVTLNAGYFEMIKAKWSLCGSWSVA